MSRIKRQDERGSDYEGVLRKEGGRNRLVIR